MNPFKPSRSFESVVRELVTGLEDGTIVLNKEVGVSPSKKQTSYPFLFSDSLGAKMKASPTCSRTNRHHKFVAEWVRVDLGTSKDLPIDFDPNQTLKVLRMSR